MRMLYTYIQVNIYILLCTYTHTYSRARTYTLGGTYNPSITHFRILSRNKTTQTVFVNPYVFTVVGVAENTYIHTYTRTYVRTYIRTHIHACIHTHTYIRTTAAWRARVAVAPALRIIPFRQRVNRIVERANAASTQPSPHPLTAPLPPANTTPPLVPWPTTQS